MSRVLDWPAIEADYRAGLPIRAIAEKYEAYPGSVSRGLRRRGVVPPARRRFDLSWPAIEVDYRAGLPRAAIAEKHEITPSSVTRGMRRRGVPVRPHRASSGSRHYKWHGGPYVTVDRYIVAAVDPSDPLAVMSPPSRRFRVPEHRLVMARRLGRPLRADETVHHINGVRDDNRIENLQLRTGNHGSGVAMCCGDCGSPNVIPQPIAKR